FPAKSAYRASWKYCRFFNEQARHAGPRTSLRRFCAAISAHEPIKSADTEGVTANSRKRRRNPAARLVRAAVHKKGVPLTLNLLLLQISLPSRPTEPRGNTAVSSTNKQDTLAPDIASARFCAAISAHEPIKSADTGGSDGEQ
ncbi:hypothetical protein MRX96_054081, partial [Rhipicephalus microplus]